MRNLQHGAVHIVVTVLLDLLLAGLPGALAAMGYNAGDPHGKASTLSLWMQMQPGVATPK